MGGCCPTDRLLKHPQSARPVLVPVLYNGIRTHPIREHYDFIKVLGFGKYGVVREAVELDSSSRASSVAIKSIPKKKLKGDYSLFTRELRVLQVLDHPNIIKLFETYEDEKYFHLVMELCPGGDLLDRLLDVGIYSELEAAAIMNKLLLAVNHMHSSYVCHRDLKPENILYAGDVIKIADFGISSKFGNSGHYEMKSAVGTPTYVAPEVLRHNYGKECDLWSLGVILFVLLSGQLPFNGIGLQALLEQILEANFSFDGHV